MERMVRIYRETMPPEEWEAVPEQATYMAPRFNFENRQCHRLTIEEVVELVKPKGVASNAPELINFSVDWLLGLGFAFGLRPDRVVQVVRGGWKLAKGKQK
jgi:hypothetical protein